MNINNIMTLLRTANLFTMLCPCCATDEERRALDLWYSGILSHEETLERLGGTPGMLSDEEYQVALDYLYHAHSRLIALTLTGT